MQVLEALLLKLRTLLSKGDLETFLETKNGDGLRAIDYCVFKNRHDMAVVL